MLVSKNGLRFQFCKSRNQILLRSNQITLINKSLSKYSAKRSSSDIIRLIDRGYSWASIGTNSRQANKRVNNGFHTAHERGRSRVPCSMVRIHVRAHGLRQRQASNTLALVPPAAVAPPLRLASPRLWDEYKCELRGAQISSGLTWPFQQAHHYHTVVLLGQNQPTGNTRREEEKSNGGSIDRCSRAWNWTLARPDSQQEEENRLDCAWNRLKSWLNRATRV